MIKKEEGITLMALVITIIVLIILAGISIGSIYDKDNIVDETENATYQAQKQKIMQAAQWIIKNKKHQKLHGL